MHVTPARPRPHHYGTLVVDGRKIGTSRGTDGETLRHMGECHNTEDVMASAVHRPSLRDNGAATHVRQHVSLQEWHRRTVKRSTTAPQTDLRTNICSSRGTFQWQCLLVCLILARPDPSLPVTTTRLIPSLIVHPCSSCPPLPASHPPKTFHSPIKASISCRPYHQQVGVAVESLREATKEVCFSCGCKRPPQPPLQYQLTAQGRHCSHLR